jgi:uncharacterized protein with von Willebrand factor type A (vWA) domain
VAEKILKKGNYKSHEAFMKACRGLPKKLRVFYYHEKLKPHGWNEERDGR